MARQPAPRRHDRSGPGVRRADGAVAGASASGSRCCPGAPTIYRSILDHPERSDYDLSTLRVAVTGAADIPVALIERDARRAAVPLDPHRLRAHRGRDVTGSRPDDDAETIATTAGRAMQDLEIVIADRDRTGQRGRAGHHGRTARARLQRDAGLPRRPRRRRPRRSTTTASCTPATSPRWTSAATCGSSDA